MAKFSDVFSTTAKVVLALVLISILCVVGSLVFFGSIAGIGTAITRIMSGNSADKAWFDKADTVRTTMRKSVWDKGMERAAEKHCYITGMNKEEVARALGEPTTKESATRPSGLVIFAWNYFLPTGKCLKYNGDNCVEKEQWKQRVIFTDKGNVLNGNACRIQNDEWDEIQSEDFFKQAQSGQKLPETPTKLENPDKRVPKRGGIASGVPGGVVGGVSRTHVRGDVQAAKLVNRVQPMYPPLARQTGISGTVKLRAVIGKDGSVQQLQVESGHPLLAQPALEAVKQWRYQQTLLNGDPVEVETEIDVIFSLTQ
jgi:TonB family protein